MTDLGFLAFLVVDGALAGAIYALVALAFVIVYKASRMINFAVGEWVMLGSRMVASGLHAFGLGLGGALGLGILGTVAVALAFSWGVLRRLFGQRLIALIMVTIVRRRATMASVEPGGKGWTFTFTLAEQPS
jgi:branched-chain amino acid transport system permease protein